MIHETLRASRPRRSTTTLRRLGVQNLVACCLNDACLHTALIDVSSYPADTEVPWFRSRVVCAKCGSRAGRPIDRVNTAIHGLGTRSDQAVLEGLRLATMAALRMC